MLDSDASFYLVPEFQSSRGARRNSRAPSSDLRFGTAYGADLALALMPDHGTQAPTAPAALGLCSASRVPGAAQPAENITEVAPQAEYSPRDTLQVAPESLWLSADDGTDDWAADLLEDPSDTASCPDSADVRAVTPRRPMRFTFARESVEHGRLALPVMNLFDGAFDPDTLTGPDVDPRLARSRARARARLAAHEASLPPEARNLWCDDGSETDAALDDQPQDAPTLTMTETAASDGSDGTPPRRAVRHLTVTRRTPRPLRDAQAIHDPLQDHLHLVRDALYAPDPDTETEPAPTAAPRPLSQRLLALLMTFALVHILLPLRTARAQLVTAQGTLAQNIRARTANLSTISLPTGILHPPLRGTAITAAVLVLAQTVPPHLM